MKSEIDAKAWDALKQLGDAALEIGGIQGVLQMFVSVITSAEQVAQDSDEAGDPQEMVSEAISGWLVSTYVPTMLEQFSEADSGD